MVENRVWLEPTLILDDVDAHRERYRNHPGERHLRMTVDEWWGTVSRPEAQTRQRQQAMARMREFVRRYSEAGGILLAGSDNAPLPGVGLHDELVLLAEAGLSPADALRAATLNPTQAFGWEDRLGTIDEGKLADLVLLDANPLEEITNTRTSRPWC